jgi:hypothetical protein
VLQRSWSFQFLRRHLKLQQLRLVRPACLAPYGTPALLCMQSVDRGYPNRGLFPINAWKRDGRQIARPINNLDARPCNGPKWWLAALNCLVQKRRWIEMQAPRRSHNQSSRRGETTKRYQAIWRLSPLVLPLHAENARDAVILIWRLSPNRQAVAIKHDTTVTRHSLLPLMDASPARVL